MGSLPIKISRKFIKDINMGNTEKHKPRNSKLPIFGVISRLLCLLNIHKPINKRFDAEYWYTNKTCERCGCDVGFPKWKRNAIPQNGERIIS